MPLWALSERSLYKVYRVYTEYKEYIAYTDRAGKHRPFFYCFRIACNAKPFFVIYEYTNHPNTRKEVKTMKRQFSDDQLKALANVFNIDTGDAFKPLTDKEVADKAREIFPQEQRDKVAAAMGAEIEKLI